MSEQRVLDVVPLATLRHRKAVQYCFTPHYNPDEPPKRRKPPQGQTSWYPGENYEDELTAEELQFFLTFQCQKVLGGDSKKSRGEGPGDGIRGAPPATKAASSSGSTEASSRGANSPSSKRPGHATTKRSRKDEASATAVSNENTKRVAAFLGVSPESPTMKQATDDLIETALGRRDSLLVFAKPSALDAIMVAQPVVPRKPRKKPSPPKLQLEAIDCLKVVEPDGTVVDPSQASSDPARRKCLRKIAYLPVPVNPPPWLPVAEADLSPPKRRKANSTSTSSTGGGRGRNGSSSPKRVNVPSPPVVVKEEDVVGRFCKDGSYVIPTTIDDELFAVPLPEADEVKKRPHGKPEMRRVASRRLFSHSAASQASAFSTTTAPRAAAHQQWLDTIQRLARPAVVAEAHSTAEEARILRYLARRDSTALQQITTSPQSSPAMIPRPPAMGGDGTPSQQPFGNQSFNLPPSFSTLDGSSVTLTPRAQRRSVVGISSPVPQQPAEGAANVFPSTQTSTGRQRKSPPSAPNSSAEAQLLYREQLPATSRSSGCVGAAEVHFWLEMGTKRSVGQIRDAEPCVAQVWMRRSVQDECHSARSVLRNYAAKIPNDAVLAVTLRKVPFGQRVFDTTVTFTYGDVLQRNIPADPIAETIRTIVRETNNRDCANFRGPFLICSADRELCQFLLSYCLGMCSAEHPELAVNGFPAASDSRQDPSDVSPRSTKPQDHHAVSRIPTPPSHRVPTNEPTDSTTPIDSVMETVCHDEVDVERDVEEDCPSTVVAPPIRRDETASYLALHAEEGAS